MDKLNIIVQAILNKQANISSINEQLKEIQSKIDKLKINIDFDEKILKTLKDFSASIQKINDLIKYQNEVIRQNTIITKEADGSTKKIEQSQLRSGEIIEKTTQIIDKNTQAIQKNIQEQQKLAQIREKYKEGSLTGITEIAKSDYHTTITNYNADKTQELTRIEIENIEKRVKAEQKAQDEISKALLKTEQNRRKEIEKSTEAQAKAINKSLELEYKAQQAEELRIQRLGALREKVSSELFEGDYDAVRNNLQKFLENFYGVNAKVVELKRNFTSAGKEVWNFTTNVKTGKDTFEQYKGSIDRTTQALYDFGPSVEKTLSRNLSIFEQFKIALARIPIWIAGMTAFYQTLRFFTNGVAYVNELNKALTEISMVTNKNQAEVAKLGKEYQKLALDMAVSTKQIAEASVTFYRQGLNQAEVMDRVKYATMGAKVAGLDFAQTAELLTATTNGMNVSIQRASDTFSYLGDATATSYDEIAKGFQKVSGTAGAMNLEFEKVASYIATVSAKTRESAESIGTSFKTIFARMSQLTEQGFNEEDETRINDVAIALAQVGISLTNVDGSFRNFGDILDELGAKWSSLDNKTKAYLGTTLAGTRQQARFYTLMENYADSVKLYEGALNSAGATQEKYNRYLQSTEAYIERLRTTATGIWQDVFDSEQIRIGIEVLTDLVGVLGQIFKTLGLLPPVLGAASLAFMALNNNIRTTFSKNGVVVLQEFITALKTLNITTITTNTAFATLGTTVKGVLSFLAGAILPVATMMALGFAIQKIVDYISKARQEAQKTKEFNDQLVKSWSANEEEIRKNIDRYNELKKTQEKGTLSTEQLNELTEVQNRLNELMPTLTQEIDAQGNAHLKNIDAIQREIHYVEELKKTYDKLTITNFEENIGEILNKIHDLNKQINTLQYENQQIANLPYIYESEEERIKREQKLIESQRQLNVYVDQLNSSIYSQIEANLNLAGVYKYLTETDQEYVKSLIEKNSQNLTSEKLVNNFTNSTYLQAKAIAEVNKQLSQYKDNIPQSEIEKVRKTLSDAGIEIDVINKIIDNHIEKLQGANQETKNYTQQQSVLGSVLSDFKNNTDILAEAYQKLNDGQNLSIDKIEELITKYPELNNAITIHNGILSINKDAIYAIIQAKETDIKTTLEKQIQAMLQEKNLIIDINKLRAEGTALLYKEAQLKYLVNWQEKFPSLSAAYQQMHRDLEPLENAINAYQKLSQIDLSKTVTTPTKTSSSKLSKEPYQSQIEATRGLQLAIQDLKNEIQKYQILADTASSDQQRIQYLNKINDLLKQEQNALHNLNQAYRQERYNIGWILEKSKAYKVAGQSVVDFDEKTAKLTINQKLYNKLSDEQKQKVDDLVQKFDELTKSIQDNSNKWFELNNNIKNNNFEVISIQIEQAKQKISDIDNQIEISKAKIQQYNKGSKEYNAEQQKQIKLLDEKKTAIQDLINLLNVFISKGNLTSDQLKQLNNDLQDYQKTLLDTNNTMIETNNSISDYINSVFDAYNNHIINSLQDQIKEWQNAKDEAQKAAQAKIDAIQAEIDALQKENDELKEQEERQKRLDEIAKQRELIANIEKEKNVRIIQNGEWVYIADPKKLADETEKLKELENDYNRWEQNNQRQHVIEQKRQQIKDIQDELKIEQDKYDTKIKRLQDFINIEQKKLNKQKEFQITNLTELMDALKGIESSAYSDRLTALQDFIDKYNKLASQLGLPELNVPTLKTVSTGSSSSNGSSSSKGAKRYNETNNNEINSILDKMAKNSQNWHNVSDSEKKKLAQENQKLGEKLRKKGVDAQYNPSTGKWNVLKYDKGGVIDYTGLAMVHGKSNSAEVIFNAEQGKKLYDFVRFVIPKLQIPNIVQSKEQFIQNFNFHIDKVETKDADSFLKLAKTLVIQYTS